ncbi:pre-mRNA-splicing factor prp46 [Salpingoeca rosetta]|uniref:Pre-mRNA-splicing factor prp46 n=1 Tax=Salpingoeca rosetta (strain ATCC 50818 / BSB-021) TaxID=946362 RepID=F2U2H7_SALR5|nr:pre-mRNA-splicing factor prp46 [Salpingoeca rosetta]EGD81829.1 pre-mRNA-splicing factor prp46 [Salpingoeca rosetta]|eukprot:XP_004997033.1 pre-mRNA-splicing factor prp46 [Salpingoeca rosetta]
MDQHTFRSIKRTKDMFVSDYAKRPSDGDLSRPAKLACKKMDEYASVMHLPPPAALKKKAKGAASGPGPARPSIKPTDVLEGKKTGKEPSSALALVSDTQKKQPMTKELVLRQRAPTMPKPQWHPHWKLFRVISGHTGWVRCLAVEPKNQWFVSGSADRTIKIWDLASGTLKLTLTGHISTVRGLEVSPRHPYLFSVGEDKMVRCWDLEQNKVIRHYHGHLSGVYALKLHPTLDVLFTGGRDSTVRLWDMRTKAQIHCLSGHTNTVASLETEPVDPQVISGSHDSTIRLWDIRAGRCMAQLTNHKKSVRALAKHPKEFTFVSGASDNIKQWYLPKGEFIQNLGGHTAIINSLAVNPSGVMVSGADNGSLSFWDYRTGYRFQDIETPPQPGSLDSESGIFGLAFDKSYSRLLTAEADKTIKIYKEDPDSTEETHPLDWKPNVIRKSRF